MQCSFGDGCVCVCDYEVLWSWFFLCAFGTYRDVFPLAYLLIRKRQKTTIQSQQLVLSREVIFVLKALGF